MFRLELQTAFSAAHAISIAGQREPLHGHDWHVTALIEGPALDGDGLLIDFHAAMAHLQEIVRPFHNSNLNQTPPFHQINPTAEHVAQYIYQTLQTRIATKLPPHPKTDGAGPPAVTVASVRVTEAIGCAAIVDSRSRP